MMPPPNMRSMIAQGGRWVVSRRRNFSSSRDSTVGLKQPEKTLTIRKAVVGSGVLGYCVYCAWFALGYSNISHRRRLMEALERQEEEYIKKLISKAA